MTEGRKGDDDAREGGGEVAGLTVVVSSAPSIPARPEAVKTLVFMCERKQ